MTRKKRILMVGESSHICSGFGNYTKEILSRLHKSGKYEVAELSCYRTPQIPKKEPWKIYPVAVNTNSPYHNQFQQNPLNQYGQWRFELTVLDFKPDIVLDIRDFWNFAYQETCVFRPFYKWIIAPTYDSSPPKIEIFNMFKNADLVLFHTKWAQQDLLKFDHQKEINIGDVINDSVDPDIFKPIEYSKKHHKQKFGIPSESFVIGSVMRNQKRKLIPDLLASFAEIKTKHNKAILYLHTTFPEKDGWNLPSLLLEYNIANSVYLTYKCRGCQFYWPSLFKGLKTICKKCANTATVCGLMNPLTEHELNNIYNLFDIYVQYAICEGFGIPQVEAAACGLPIITVNHGAMADIGSTLGAKLVEIAHEFKELETEAIRVYPNNKNLIQHIESYINMPLDNLIEISKQSRKNLINNYSWDKTANKLMNILDNLDISENLSWDLPKRTISNIHVPSLPNRDFVYFIIDNIIQDPFLKKTVLIENMIKDLDAGIVFRGNNMIQYTQQQAVEELQIYLGNKIAMENIRCGEAVIPDHFKDCMNYA